MFVLKDKLIQKSIPETSSIQQVLTSPYLFHQLILRNTDHSQGYTRLTFAETIDRGMIEKNIKYMMNLWLSPNTTILLDKRMYTILQTQPKILYSNPIYWMELEWWWSYSYKKRPKYQTQPEVN